MIGTPTRDEEAHVAKHDCHYIAKGKLVQYVCKCGCGLEPAVGLDVGSELDVHGNVCSYENSLRLGMVMPMMLGSSLLLSNNIFFKDK